MDSPSPHFGIVACSRLYENGQVNISIYGVIGILACLLIALLPLPRRAEGVRIGFFGALMAFVFFDAAREGHTGEPITG